jgi:hypothetical protein
MVGICVGAFVPFFLNVVIELGANIPSPDLISDYVFAFGWALALGGLIVLLPITSHHRADLLIAWSIRCGVTLGFMLLAESFYPVLDSYSYYERPKAANFEWSGFDISSGSSNIRNLVWLHDLVLPDSYHALKVTWSFFGLLGGYFFYRAVVLLLGHDDRRAFYILSLTPSILYWSSNLGKDPISFLGIGLYALGTVGWYRRKSKGYLLLMLLGVVIATYIRSWYGPLLLAPLVAFAITTSRGQGSKGFIARLSFVGLLGVGMIYALGKTPFGSSLESTESLLETTNTINSNFSKGGSAVEVSASGSLSEFLLNLPVGAFTALFRPLPGEVMNLFGIMSGLENLVILALAMIALTRLRLRHLRNPVFLWAVILVGLWAVMYGATASTNLGTIVRYRLQVLPLLIGLVAYLVSTYNHGNRKAVE